MMTNKKNIEDCSKDQTYQEHDPIKSTRVSE